jgi:hypothetical protein
MIFKTKPQYLLSINESILPCSSERIYKIDYHVNTKNFKAYPLTESLDRSMKPVIIITIYSDEEINSYRWYRPNIDAVIAEGNMELLKRFVVQDVLVHI